MRGPLGSKKAADSPSATLTVHAELRPANMCRPRAPLVAIVCSGSRGDCQPFIALALELKGMGMGIKFYIDEEMLDIFVPFIPRDELFLLAHSKMQSYIRYNPEVRDCMATVDFLTFLRLLNSKAMLDVMVLDAKDLLRDAQESQPQLIVYNSCACFQGAAVAEALEIPSVMVTMQMMVAVSSKEAPPMLVSPEVKRFMPGCLIRLSWILLRALYARSEMIKHMDSEFRCKSLGVQPLTISQIKKLLFGRSPGCSVIVARSPLLSPPPDDWSDKDKRCITGALVLSREQQLEAWPVSVVLRAFLAGGDESNRPVYFGWGSMTAGSPARMVELAVRAVKAVDRRAVILAGWAQLSLAELKDCQADDVDDLVAYAEANIHFLSEDSVPHEWLFPQMAALVHHGGAGTTASALRSGVPSIITPCAFDQPEVAEKVEKAGVGIREQQFHRLTAKALTIALKRALSDTGMRDRAAAFGQQLCQEAGATAAALHVKQRLKAGTYNTDGRRAYRGSNLAPEAPEQSSTAPLLCPSK